MCIPFELSLRTRCFRLIYNTLIIIIMTSLTRLSYTKKGATISGEQNEQHMPGTLSSYAENTMTVPSMTDVVRIPTSSQRPLSSGQPHSVE